MPCEDDGGGNQRATRDRVTARLLGVLGDPAAARRVEVAHWNRTITTFAHDHGPGAVVWANPAFRYRYTTKALGLEHNLRHAPGIAPRVLARELAPRVLVAMTPGELWPERWEDAYAKVAARQLRREACADAATAPDGAFTCGRCKSAKTVYTSMQIRSADEPMTNFIRCLMCGKSWKD